MFWGNFLLTRPYTLHSTHPLPGFRGGRVVDARQVPEVGDFLLFSKDFFFVLLFIFLFFIITIFVPFIFIGEGGRGGGSYPIAHYALLDTTDVWHFFLTGDFLHIVLFRQNHHVKWVLKQQHALQLNMQLNQQQNQLALTNL